MSIMIYDKLVSFLKKFPKTEGEHTHTIYGGEFTGSFTIPPERLDDLYKLVHRAIFVKKNEITMIEKVQQICRLVVDLDFKYKEKLKERQYNQEILRSIIMMIFTSIDKHYECPEDKKVCFVMEKETPLDAPQSNYESKDGIHLLFPYIIANKESYKILRKSILENDISELCKKESMIPPSNSMDEIIDENIYKGGNWFLYGCGKPNEITYKLTNIFQVSGNGLTSLDTEMYLEDPLEIIKLNSVSLQPGETVGYTDNMNQQIDKQQLKKKAIINSISSDSLESMEYNDPLKLHTKTRKHDLDLAKGLINCLSIQRAGEYKSWIDVGCCLHSIGGDIMLPYWISFSRKWGMWQGPSECNQKWNTFKTPVSDGGQLTIASLHYWAKKDDPELYKTVLRDSLEKLVQISVKGDKTTGAHSDVANVIYHYFKDSFICSELRSKTWYYFNEFNGGKWEETEQGHILRSKLSSEIVDLYEHFARMFKEKAQSEYDETTKEVWDKKHTNALRVQIQLKDSTYKEKIMKECGEYFYDKTFIDKLNDKKHLLGFENGIYDLKTSEFREGLPDDHVSLSCGLMLPVIKSSMPIHINDIIEESKEINNHSELVGGLDDFLEKVFPIDDVREYTLRFLSSCLSGEIREEKFYFWTGSGGNGKSKLVELIDFTFGDYSRSMDVAYLTTKKGSSSAASPELENVKSARFVYLSEPEKADQIYVGKLKLMTGGDKMTTRGLFKETTQFKPQFKMILMCNDLPKLAGNDGGIWRRIEVVNYQAKFSDNPRPSPADPYQYLADEQLSTKLKEWKLLFMIKLLDKYRIYNKEGTKPPEDVKKATKSYRTCNDIIANWISDDIIPCDEFSSFDELYDAWERWCDDEGYNPKQRPNKQEVKLYLLNEQEKSEYGLVMGKKMDEKCPNGTKRKPKFNFKSVDE